MSAFSPGCLPGTQGRQVGRKNREPAGEGARGRGRGCEKLRTDVARAEVGGEGETGGGRGRGRLFAPARRSRLPSRLRPAPPLGPAPAPPRRALRPGGGSGEIPSWGLLVPEQVSALPTRSQNPGVQSRQPRRPPHPLRPGTRALGGPESCLCCPQPGTPAGHAPAGAARAGQTVSAQREALHFP